MLGALQVLLHIVRTWLEGINLEIPPGAIATNNYEIVNISLAPSIIIIILEFKIIIRVFSM
jgi:hypothetical protein